MDANFYLEKVVLRVLCLGTSEGSVKKVLVPLLRDYPWQVQLYKVIFDALQAIPSDDPAVLRQLLPAKLTRMGFPDVEWDEFFAPHSISRDEAIVLVQRMVNEA